MQMAAGFTMTDDVLLPALESIRVSGRERRRDRLLNSEKERPPGRNGLEHFPGCATQNHFACDGQPSRAPAAASSRRTHFQNERLGIEVLEREPSLNSLRILTYGLGIKTMTRLLAAFAVLLALSSPLSAQGYGRAPVFKPGPVTPVLPPLALPKPNLEPTLKPAPLIIIPPAPAVTAPPPDAGMCCKCPGRDDCSDTCCLRR